MDIAYSRKHDKSLMIIAGTPIDCGFEENMVRTNNISSLLPFYIMNVDGQSQYYYDITGKEGLLDYIDRVGISVEIVKSIIFRIHLAYKELEKYLINQNHISLSPETVFVDRDTMNISLCYYPMEMGSAGQQFRGIMEYILAKMDHSKKDLMYLCYELYEITMNEDYSLMQLVDHISAGQIEQEKPEVVQIDLREGQQEYENEIFEEEAEPESWTERLRKFFESLFLKVSKRNDGEQEHRAIDFDMIPVMDESEETVILTAPDKHIVGKLVYDGINDEENFIIEKDVFKIGSDAQNNDGVIKSKAVSRSHAQILRQGSSYYLNDMNSTNGTAINGQLLAYNQQVLLHSMDKIKFADASYVFM